MQLQYTGKDVPAPVVLGNDDENSYLQAGMFFALPIENLFFYSFCTSTQNVQLTPFHL